MKSLLINAIIIFLPVFLFSQTLKKISLNYDWKFRQIKDSVWYPANVPGTVHTDLLLNGLIPEPYFGDNEKSLQWIEKENWEYKTTFDLNERIFKKQEINIIFDGVDTFADIYLNDSLILKCDNMFRTWKADCKKIIKKENNELKIYFHSAVKVSDSLAKNYFNEQGIKGLPGGNQVFARKAAYHFGWDFAPRFVTSGMWKQVYIEGWDFFKFGKIQIFQKDITRDTAIMSSTMEVSCTKDSDFLVHITDKGTGERLIYHSDKLKAGKNIIKFDFIIPNPKLWWCNGTGEPYLYNLFIEATDNRERWNETEMKIGLRKVELIQEKDNFGESFYFKLNDVPVFIKGANYIPQDMFLPNVTRDKLQKLLVKVKNSNMNMLRVWGGGIYQDDYFYDLCDSLGIMVWQDFMFACAMYPGSKEFFNNIKKEAIDNIERLRNHPCIALWCGNNEIDEGWNNWGWQKEFSYDIYDSAKIKNDYNKLFEVFLPAIIHEKSNPHFFSNEISQFNYISSSPKIGWGHQEAMTEGDSHYWGVWWGNEPFEIYEQKVPRFMSEYGFQSFPNIETINSFTTTEDRYLYSDVLKAHQKHPTGFETIKKYMDFNIFPSNDLESYIKETQVLQYWGIKKAIESHRRAKPYCMGTMFWQLNDCWPGITWSAIDYYGTEKLLMKNLKELYSDIIISPIIEKEIVKIYIVSDKLYKSSGKLYLNLKNIVKNISVWSKEIQIEISGSSVKVCFEIEKKNLINNYKEDEIVLSCSFMNSDFTEEYSNNLIFVPLIEYKGILK